MSFVLADEARERQPVLARHHDVEHDEVDLGRLHRLARGGGALRHAGAKPVLGQVARQRSRMSRWSSTIRMCGVRSMDCELNPSFPGGARENCNRMYRLPRSAMNGDKNARPPHISATSAPQSSAVIEGALNGDHDYEKECEDGAGDERAWPWPAACSWSAQSYAERGFGPRRGMMGGPGGMGMMGGPDRPARC